MRLGYDLRDKRGGYLKRHCIQLTQLGCLVPVPPLLTGSDNSSRSLAVHVWPVIDGIRASLIARPNGSSSSSISDNHERTQRVFTISFVGT